MAPLLQLASFFVFSMAVAAATRGSLLQERKEGCSANTTQVVPWSHLTPEEKSSYLNASVCLTQEPAKIGLGGSKTRWDEFQYNHIHQVSWIHFVGQFLPWHRYFVSVHRSILRDECGYTGRLPYWDEVADSDLTDLADSIMFQADTFGGNGTGTDLCIDNGPFAGVNLTFNTGPCGFPACNSSTTADDHCIFRELSTEKVQAINRTAVDECLNKTDFVDVWNCIENGPHANGHGAVAGLMGSVAYSPGDPIFYLHHAFVDLLWWRWQLEDLDTRLTAIGGTNAPTQEFCDTFGDTCPGPAILDYNGDPGNTTTLNHVLWLMGIYPNVTVADVMNINSTDVCFDYIW